MPSRSFEIARCEVYEVPIPLHEPFQIALMTSHAAHNVFVRLTTRDDRHGWGEASPLHSVTGETVGTCLAASELLGRYLIGRSCLETHARARELAALLPHNAAIRSAFDMALHDLAAQAAGMPLYLYLGGAERELVTDLTLGIGSPESTEEKARHAVGMGFRHLKIKLGLKIERDVTAVRSVREAVGPEVRFRLDANQAWGRQEAVANLQRLAAYDIQFCEQPVPQADLDGLRFVSESGVIPIMADESAYSPVDVFRIARERVAPHVNLKVAKSGGISSLLDADAVAAAAGLTTMIGCMMESRLGLTASAHAVLACRSVRFLDLDTVFDLAEDPVVGGIQYERDQIHVPQEPGLGASLDLSVLDGRLVHTMS